MKYLQQLGIKSIRPEQEPVIDSLLAGRDTLAIMPTGSGKSLCYQYPALKMEGTAIVVSPLIALMKDQIDSLKKKGVPAEFINSSLTHGKKVDITRKLEANKLKLLYVSPETLTSEPFYHILNKIRVSFFAIDEAHCISTWGHDFRKAYRELSCIKAGFPDKPIISLTATATFETRKDIIEQLDMKDYGEFVYSFDRPNLTFSVVNKANSSILSIVQNHADRQMIMYGFTRQDAEVRATTLNHILGHKIKIPFLPYHSRMSNKIKAETQDRFMSGEVNVITTKAFGMGIDNSNVGLVLHNHITPTLEDLYQEQGRAGRDGKKANCILRFDSNDIYKMDCFLENTHANTGRYPIMHEKLMKVGLYCTSRECRRKTLLTYFGEIYTQDNCGACDVCLRN
jgi:ATP-dependent DNA helicase RecQ